MTQHETDLLFSLKKNMEGRESMPESALDRVRDLASRATVEVLTAIVAENIPFYAPICSLELVAREVKP